MNITKLIRTALLAAITAFPASEAWAVNKADLIFTGGIVGTPLGWVKELPVGHAGIFVGTKRKGGKIEAIIADCVPNFFNPGGTRLVGWKEFTHNFKFPYYGNRTTKVPPTPAQREEIVKHAISHLGVKYNDNHLTQKGPVEFDCVGFTEHAYEMAGLNPTPDKLEFNMGWPLTPAEQFSTTIAALPGAFQTPPITVPYATHGKALQDLTGGDLPDQPMPDIKISTEKVAE